MKLSNMVKNTFRYCLTTLYLISLVEKSSLETTAIPVQPRAHAITYLGQEKPVNAKLHGLEFQKHDNESFYSTNQAIGHFVGKIVSNSNNQKPKSIPIKNHADLPSGAKDTFENTNILLNNDLRNKPEGFADNSFKENYRFKQSIPALQPVQHLLNAVREGNLNHTVHSNKSLHHLISPIAVNTMSGGEESSAIETEAEREMVSHSEPFLLIDMIGQFASKMLEWIMKLFSASVGGSAVSSLDGTL